MHAANASIGTHRHASFLCVKPKPHRSGPVFRNPFPFTHGREACVESWKKRNPTERRTAPELSVLVQVRRCWYNRVPLSFARFALSFWSENKNSLSHPVARVCVSYGLCTSVCVHIFLFSSHPAQSEAGLERQLWRSFSRPQNNNASLCRARKEEQNNPFFKKDLEKSSTTLNTHTQTQLEHVSRYSLHSEKETSPNAPWCARETRCC